MNGDTTYLPMVENAGNSPAVLDPIQQKLAPHVDAMISFWILVWIITACVVLHRLYTEYCEQAR